MAAARSSEELALQQTIYDSRNPTRRWLHRCRRDWVLARLQEGPVTVRRALEIGPGAGVYLPAMAARADEILVTDVDETYLTHARALAKDLPQLQVRRDDISATALPTGQFDLILCSEVIEHLPDSAPALAAMARLLAPGGRLILTTPQRYSTLELCGRVAFLPGVIHLLRAIYREPVLPTGHINLLTVEALGEQLEGAGLAVLSRARLGFYLPLLAEFGGHWGQRVLAWLEARLQNTPLACLLWTQCYVLTPLGVAEVAQQEVAAEARHQ